MAFTTNLSGTTQVDDSVVLAYDQQFLIAAAQEAVMDQFVTYKKDIGAKSISFPKYSQLALATTALTETDDPASEAMVDAAITLTPAEYGNVVTRTLLASLQTGGKVDAAAAKLVGINMGRTLDKLALLAAEASANTLAVNAGGAASNAATDVMSIAEMNIVYNKLARASVPTLDGGFYVAIMHDDVIHDLRTATGTGSWQDISKYQNGMDILKNEVGMIAGFRVIRNNHATIVTDEGALTVDNYISSFLGYNAIGKAVSKEPGMVMTGPFDKLNRFVNVGWHGVLQYKLVDQDALWTVKSASSIGANA